MKEQLKNELLALASQKDQTSLIARLKELIINQEIDEKKLLEFLGLTWKGTRKFIASSDTISKLSIDLSKIYKEIQKQYLRSITGSLIKLAALRGSATGKRDYARAAFYGWWGIKNDFDIAFKYSEEAIKANLDCHYIKAKVLMAKEQVDEAISEFLKIHKDETANSDWMRCKDELCNILKEIEENASKAQDKETLETFIQHVHEILQFDHEEIRNKCYYILGLVYFELGDCKNAMINLIKVSSTDEHYKLALAVIKNCYLKYGREILGLSENPMPVEQPESTDMELTPADDKEILQTSEDSKKIIDFPDGTTGIITLESAWTKLNADFDSVDEVGIRKIDDAWKQSFDLTTQALNAQHTAVKKRLDQKAYGVMQASDEQKLQDTVTKLAEQKSVLNAARKKYKDESLPYRSHQRKRLRRTKTEFRFFDPARTLKKQELFDLYSQILDARMLIPGPTTAEDAKTEKTISLTGRSSRQLLMAERLFQQVAIQLIPEKREGSFDYQPLGIPKYSDKIDKGAGPDEFYKVGEYKTAVVHAVCPSRNRPGNILLPNMLLKGHDKKHGNYDEIYQALHLITNGISVNEKRLAGLIIEYANKYQPITLEKLREINPHITKDFLPKFHNICLLITFKEQSQWLMTRDEQYQTGLAVAQSRCLILIREGYLTFEQVFKRGEYFGIFSQERILMNFKVVEEAIQSVENLYTEYLKHKRHPHQAHFFAKFSEETPVLTRKRARQDLGEVHGGAEESDGEENGYDSDISYGAGR